MSEDAFLHNKFTMFDPVQLDMGVRPALAFSPITIRVTPSCGVESELFCKCLGVIIFTYPIEEFAAFRAAAILSGSISLEFFRKPSRIRENACAEKEKHTDQKQNRGKGD